MIPIPPGVSKFEAVAADHLRPGPDGLLFLDR